jgi:hypothetical protein
MMSLVLTYDFHNLLHNLFLNLINYIIHGDNIDYKKSVFLILLIKKGKKNKIKKKVKIKN